MVNQPTDPGTLKGWLPMSLGVLAIAVGGLWMLQGLDVLTGSRMSGIGSWAVIGPVIAVAGLVLVVIGVKARTRSKHTGSGPLTG